MQAKLKRLSVCEIVSGGFELRADWTNGRHQVVRIELFDNVEDRLMQFADYIQRDRQEGLLEEVKYDAALVRGFIKNACD